ncbi:MAG: hypothetical protein IKV76_07240 [Clostridia bacterium]|nr:hypothetical protein [Clostridia bacterium]
MQKEDIIFEYQEQIKELKKEWKNIFYFASDNNPKIVDTELYHHISMNTYNDDNENIKNLVNECKIFNSNTNIPIEFLYKMSREQLDDILKNAKSSLTKSKSLIQQIDWTLNN